MVSWKSFEMHKWPLILGLMVLLVLLNMNPTIHAAIINTDMLVAVKMNSMLGASPFIDQTLAWLNSRVGDACVLTCICMLFFIQSLRAGSINGTIKRLSFWIWLGILCLITYLISCVAEYFVKRDTPILAIHPFKNLQAMYGIVLHTDPTSSFPSGHALAYLFFAMMAWQRYFRMSIFLWCLAIVMLSLRMMVGLHWLSDIMLGSLFISMLLAALIDETPLKNTYKLVEPVVSFAIRKLIHLPILSEAIAKVNLCISAISDHG